MNNNNVNCPSVEGLPLEERKKFITWFYEEFYPKHFISSDKKDLEQQKEIETLQFESEKKRLENQISQFKNQIELQAIQSDTDKKKLLAENQKWTDQLTPHSLVNYMDMLPLDFQHYVIKILGAKENLSGKGSDGILPDTSIEVKTQPIIDKECVTTLIGDMKLENNKYGLLIHRSNQITIPAHESANKNNITIRHIKEILG
jgi:hypothetical protein